ncbi:MAG: stage II sporulation protein M [Eubacteriales bacterium]|nr:stage II sporulation protein M [Eubacteriales bacterium]
MEKKKMQGKRRGGLPSEILFLAGFFLGTILPNLAWRFQWKEKYMASLGLLLTLSEGETLGMEFFGQVLRLRLPFLCFCILCGFSVFGLPLAILVLVGEGFGTGLVLSVSILQLGLAGGALGAGLLLPHYLLYLPASFYLMGQVGEESLEMWKNKGLFPRKAAAYCGRCLGAGGVYFLGCLLEAWVNPWIVEKILERINFF